MTKPHQVARVIQNSPLMARKRRWSAAMIAIVCFVTQLGSSRASTIVVTNLAPSGPGTLRSALTNAQNGDTITFAVTGTITNVILGGLTISNNLSIVGPGPNLLSLTGTNICRAFKIPNAVVVNISGLTFSNCYGWDIGSDPIGGNGGAILNLGNLSLSNCLFIGCHNINGGTGFPGGTGGSGGAIHNGGTLTALNCEFLNNYAGHGGAGSPGNTTSSYPGGNGGSGGNGGAVYDAGTARFINCTFGWNASGYGGAGGVGVSASPAGGGGNGGNAGNGSAVLSLGGASFAGCTFFGNTNGAGGSGGNGGAQHAGYPGPPGGNAGNGGSGTIYCTGAVQLVACTIANNAAGRGGNGGTGGAGVNNLGGGPGLAGGTGGNGAIGGSGGGCVGLSTNAAFTLQNVLIAQNSAGGAGSAGSGGAGGSGTPSGSSGSAGTSGTAGTGPDLYGTYISNGHNFVGLRTGSSGFTNNLLGDIVGTSSATNAKAGTLTNNSGAVWTCALQSGSPALDGGDDSIMIAPANLATDARGFPRQSGVHVDIGAYEHQWATTPVISNATISSGGVQVLATNVSGAYFSVLAASSLTTPLASWTVVGIMSETSPGQFQWTDASYTNRSSRFFRLRNP